MNTFSKKHRILIVDDNKEFVAAFQFLLRDNVDHKIETLDVAFDGLQALDKNFYYNYDIIFMDINLPGHDGIQITKTISKQNRYLNIIGLSMHSDFKYIEEMIASGAKYYIIKDELSAELIKTLFESFDAQLLNLE